MEGLMSRSGKKLLTFEFERQNIAGCCKQNFWFQFNIKLIQSKKWFLQFSQHVEAKIQISLHYRILTQIPLSFIKSLELWNWISKKDLKIRSKKLMYFRYGYTRGQTGPLHGSCGYQTSPNPSNHFGCGYQQSRIPWGPRLCRS